METFLPLFLGLMWACSLVLSYGVGWLRGYDVADDNHRWSSLADQARAKPQRPILGMPQSKKNPPTQHAAADGINTQ
jgi:hypothetical protein